MKISQAVGAIATILGVGAAWASPVTVDFSGTVQSVDAGLGATVTAGELFTGSFVYEPTTVASVGGDSSGADFNALLGVNLQIGTFSQSISGASEIVTGHDPDAMTDTFQVLADSTLNNSTGFAGGSLNGLSANDFFLTNTAAYGTIFSDAQVLPSALGDVSSAYAGLSFLQLGFADPNLGSDDFIEASLDSLTTVSGATVPEPGTMALVALGMAALIGRRRTPRSSIRFGSFGS